MLFARVKFFFVPWAGLLGAPMSGGVSRKAEGLSNGVAYPARKSAKNIERTISDKERPKSNTEFFSHGGREGHKGGNFPAPRSLKARKSGAKTEREMP
jgi:hypothetical protein